MAPSVIWEEIHLPVEWRNISEVGSQLDGNAVPASVHWAGLSESKDGGESEYEFTDEEDDFHLALLVRCEMAYP
jgi:hypothetical protein